MSISELVIDLLEVLAGFAIGFLANGLYYRRWRKRK